MKICELRRFFEDFLVYVNSKEDIDILNNDKRFKVYATYRDRLGKLKGIEFRFSFSGTMQNAKKFVKDILNSARKNGKHENE